MKMRAILLGTLAGQVCFTEARQFFYNDLGQQERRTESSGMPLLGGRFETTSDVQDIINLGLDIATIENESDDTKRELIYRGGRTAFDGGQQQELSLASLSIDASLSMQQDSFFAIYGSAFKTWGLENGDDKGFFLERPIVEYGDTILSDLMDRKIQYAQTEAALVLNVWMATVHELLDTVHSCRVDNNSTASLVALDRAAAFWIGESQGYDSSNLGNMLYRLTEAAAARFGNSEHESWVNRRIVELLNSVQTNLAITINCSSAANSAVIHDEIYRIINLMTIPILQNLIHFALTEENDELVSVYKYAAMPQVLVCDPNLESELALGSLSTMTKNQKLQWVQSLQGAYSCFRLTCNEIGVHSTEGFPTCQYEDDIKLAGYSAFTSEAQDLSYIDRDVVQLKALLDMTAYDAAFDLYTYGYNAPYSLQSFALNEVIPKRLHSLFDLYNLYYGTDTDSFIDDEIRQILSSESPFEHASTEQVTALVVGLVKYEALYLSVVSALETAAANCWEPNTSDSTSATKYWDMGAALYIGSVEGHNAGGKVGGQLLFGESKRLCDSFDTCFSGNSRVNNLILESFSEGSSLIISEDCDGLENLLKLYIIPSLQATIIQGTLFNAAVVENLDAGSDDSAVGTVHSVWRGIMPQIMEANNESAVVINNNLRFNHSAPPAASGLYRVAEAFYQALPDMEANCQSIGTLKSPSLSLCDSPQFQQDTNDLAFGRYSFAAAATASELATIAEDVRDMVASNNVEEANDIYENGKNVFHSSYFDGIVTVSLASFSRDAGGKLSQDPMFNVFKYALYDDLSFDDVDEDFAFADNFVQAALTSTQDKKLAAESAVVLNVWMMITHHLYQAVRACKVRGNAKIDVDSAVALWLGREQGEGTFDDGWLLYSIGQSAAKKFGHEEKEAAANTELMEAFTELQSMSDTCKTDGQRYVDMRVQTIKILRLLSLPLIQHLLAAIAAGDQLHVELYAASVVPQCAACSSKAHLTLNDALSNGFSTEDMDDELIESISVFLRCMRITCDDLSYTTDADTQLQSLVADVCQSMDRLSRFDDASLDLTMGKLSLDPVAAEAGRVDLDVLQIGIFMRTKAYEAALDTYLNGQNALSTGAARAVASSSELLSLHELAILQQNDPVEQLEALTEYYGSSTYADGIIKDGLQQHGQYADATRLQLADLVSTTLKTMVSYLMTVWNLHQATTSCQTASASEAASYWNRGVALFIGSEDMAWNSDRSGHLLHSLGVEQCSSFSTCAENGNSAANEVLLELFLEGRAFLESQACVAAQQLLLADIVPLIDISLIQGSLSEVIAGHNSNTTELDGEEMVAGYIFAQSILPIVDKSNSHSAQTIANVYSTPFEVISSPDDVEDMFEAVKYALPRINIECSSLGLSVERPDLSLCHEYDVPDSLDIHGSIGLDVAEMRTALLEDRGEYAQMIYVDGKNGFEVLDDGKQKLTSLQLLSTEGSLEMTKEPLYNLFLYSHSPSVTDHKTSYADDFVQDILKHPRETAKGLAAEAAVALNVWMYIVHFLHEAVETCDSDNNAEKTNNNIDKAASYWVGDAQLGSNGSNGHLLYSLAEEMNVHFDSVVENVPSVNDHFLNLIAEAKHYVAAPGACTATANPDLYTTVNKIVSEMTIPLVQGLIHSLKTGDKERVQLYAYTVAPMVVACNPAEYQFLQSSLVESNSFPANVEDVIDRVYGILPCLGVRCDKVGIHSTEMTGQETPLRCFREANTTTYAGYRPLEYGAFEEHVRIDVDLKEIDLLMELGSYEAAEIVYSYGRHSSTSLGALATDPGRRSLEHYGLYASYFNSDTYSDEFVREAIVGSDNRLSNAKRRSLATRFSQMVLLPQAALHSMSVALSRCDNAFANNKDDLITAWEVGASLLIGSIDRSTLPDSHDWYAPYDLGQDHCAEFGTCSSNDGVADVNAALLELLYSGRGAIIGASCSTIGNLLDEITDLLLVPVIQSTLSSSLALSSDGHTDSEKAEGYASSRAVLPLVANVDEVEETRLERLFPLHSDSYSRNTANGAFSLFSRIYPELEVECAQIGSAAGFNPCVESSYVVSTESGDSGMSAAILIGIILLSLFVVIGVFAIWWLFRTRPNKQSNLEVMADFSNHDDYSPTSKNNIEKSFNLKSPRISGKANRALSRILRYGDDATNIRFPTDSSEEETEKDDSPRSDAVPGGGFSPGGFI